MTDAPERIYLDGDVEAGDGMFPRCFEDAKYASEPPVEYIRADLSQAAVETLEAKLAKAVWALEKLDVGEGWAAQIARTTLAELKGQEDEGH